MTPVSGAQLRSLQALYSVHARRSLDTPAEDARRHRLEWAARILGRTVQSFTELRSDEAATLIDALKQSLGQRVTPPRRPRSRQAALAAGTHGRRGFETKLHMLATADDVQDVHNIRERLGWTQEHFEKWLASPSSPLGKRGDPVLRTIADCNRVRWALKAMASRRAG